MTAWSSDFSAIPFDMPFLVRRAEWDCPAVVKRATYSEWTGLVFVEQLLADVAGGLDDDDLIDAQWAPIPE